VGIVGRERLQGKRRLWLESLKYFVVCFLTSLSLSQTLCACLSGLSGLCAWVSLESPLFSLAWFGLGWYGSGGGLVWSAWRRCEAGVQPTEMPLDEG
jgi:hypothetical protein